MSKNKEAQVRLDSLGRWIVEVPYPNRDKPVLLVAESETDALATADAVNKKLLRGDPFPTMH